jgi:hypothetical protein
VTVTATDPGAGGVSTWDLVGTCTVTVTPSIFVLNATANGTLTLSGNASVRILGAVVVDSSSTTAISAGGNAKLAAAVTDVLTNPLIVGMLNLSGNVALTQIAVGSDSMGDTSGIANTLLTGDLSVYITDPPEGADPQTAAEFHFASTAQAVVQSNLVAAVGTGGKASGRWSVVGGPLPLANGQSSVVGGHSLSTGGPWSAVSSQTNARVGSEPSLVVQGTDQDNEHLLWVCSESTGLSPPLVSPDQVGQQSVSEPAVPDQPGGSDSKEPVIVDPDRSDRDRADEAIASASGLRGARAIESAVAEPAAEMVLMSARTDHAESRHASNYSGLN